MFSIAHSVTLTRPLLAHAWIKRIAVMLAVLWCNAVFQVSYGASEPAQIVPAQVALAGQQVARLKVNQPGFYQVQARSQVGAQIRLRSRLTGPGEWSGVAGERDGRIDTLLDVGEYLIDVDTGVAAGAAAGQGPTGVSLKAQLAVERNVAETQLPRSSKILSSRLRDGEARSFWFVVDTPKTLAFEVAGRALVDAGVFRDGTWLMSARQLLVQRSPSVGEPLNVIEMAVQLEPGRYQLRAFGGNPLQWSSGRDLSPLYVRREFARLGAVHRGRHIAGPFGVDRFLVPRGTNLVRLELPLAQPSQLRVAPYTPAWPFADSGQVARIEKRQREPIAQLILGRGGDVSGALGTEFDLVSVTRASGAAYTLQLAALTKRHVITKPGVYRIQPVPLGPARDHAPITALIFSGPRARKRHDLSQSAAIELRRNSVLERQFNLSRTVEIFFRVVDSGRYEISGSGAAARHVVRPYGRPAKGKWSEREPDANATMDLAKGYYRLRIKPEEAGIHRLAIASLEASDRSQGELMSSTGTVEIVTVKPGHEAVIGIADAAEHVGLAVRGLPSRLRTPLPIVLDPGHTVSVPIVLSSSGQVRLENAADSNDFQLRVAGQLAPVDTQVLDLAAGTHLLSVASRALAPRQIALKFTPSESQAVNVSAAQSLVPSVPVGASVWLDLKSNEPQQLHLDIAEDGLYHLASSGLLATAARLHARLIPNLAAVSANGRGRNFKLLRYLRKGQYRAQIETVGRSAGATRVQLDVVPVTDGGVLDAASVFAPEAGAGAHVEAYCVALDIAQAGRYRIRAMNRAMRHQVALTDPRGWPLIAPGSAGELMLDLRKGRHVLWVYPDTTAAPVVVDFDLMPSAPILRGHGPHNLALGTPANHLWLSDAADDYVFKLTASGEVRITLSADMAAELRDSTGAAIAAMHAPEDWVGMLHAGAYGLAVRHARNANRVPYSLRVATAELLPGGSRKVALPTRIPVSIPGAQTVRLSTRGDVDVRATLRSADGRIVAHGDDQGSNWNFSIERRFDTAARYMLHVEPVEAAAATTTVQFAVVDDSADVNATLMADSDVAARVVDLSSAATGTTRISAQTGVTIRLPEGRMGIVRTSSLGASASAVPDAAVTVANAGIFPSYTQTSMQVAFRAAPRELQLLGATVNEHALQLEFVPFSATDMALSPSGYYGLAPGAAIALRYPAGVKRLRFDLPAAALAMVDGDTIGGTNSGRWVVDTRAQYVLLFNTSQLAASVHLVAETVAPAILDSAPFSTLRADVLGHWRPLVDAKPGAASARLHALSANTSAPVTIVAGREVRHARGLVLAWTDVSLASAPSNAVAGLTDTPAHGHHFVVAASGTALALERARTAALLTLRASAPILVRLGGLETAQMRLLEAGDTHFYRGIGPASLQVWPLLASPIPITAALLSAAPTELHEGLSAMQSLAIGQSALYEFQMISAGQIGVGARGGREKLAMRVLDASGRAVGSGIVQTHDLAAGRYHVLVSNLADLPQQVQVGLVGTKPPLGPPAQIVKQFLARFAAQGAQR